MKKKRVIIFAKVFDTCIIELLQVRCSSLYVEFQESEEINETKSIPLSSFSRTITSFYDKRKKGSKRYFKTSY